MQQSLKPEVPERPAKYERAALRRALQPILPRIYNAWYTAEEECEVCGYEVEFHIRSYEKSAEDVYIINEICEHMVAAVDDKVWYDLLEVLEMEAPVLDEERVTKKLIQRGWPSDLERTGFMEFILDAIVGAIEAEYARRERQWVAVNDIQPAKELGEEAAFSRKGEEVTGMIGLINYDRGKYVVSLEDQPQQGAVINFEDIEGGVQ